MPYSNAGVQFMIQDGQYSQKLYPYNEENPYTYAQLVYCKDLSDTVIKISQSQQLIFNVQVFVQLYK